MAAPPLMWSETLAVLHRAAWSGETSPDLAATARDQLVSAPVSPEQPADLYLEAWRVADLLGWGRTYDAEYVALARLLGCRLVTVDERLRRGARRAVQVVGPADL